MERNSPLDNPIWNALNSRHSAYAIGEAAAKRYPVAVAPFVAVEDGSAGALEAIAEIVAPGEQFVMLSVMPEFGSGWQAVKEMIAYQYVWDRAPGGYDLDDEIEALSEADIPAMLELTALVYPAYFREGTARLGRYFGVKKEGRLAAMAGIRMAMAGFQEISAVCTHPDHRGKGYASRLSRHLVDHIQRSGDTPFLHTESYNVSAQAVYEKLGFSRRAILPLNLMARNSV